ncbi:hypothetical protein WBG99_18320 [Streptomyces sp. TG1A-60]|uniref:hypothetical protein n=1 Tax=Streptomyces sp. TG1A-60 TaxID=3129111 RepID=UPI0030D5026A
MGLFSFRVGGERRHQLPFAQYVPGGEQHLGPGPTGVQTDHVAEERELVAPRGGG